LEEKPTEETCQKGSNRKIAWRQIQYNVGRYVKNREKTYPETPNSKPNKINKQIKISNERCKQILQGDKIGASELPPHLARAFSSAFRQLSPTARTPSSATIAKYCAYRVNTSIGEYMCIVRSRLGLGMGATWRNHINYFLVGILPA
jgi:hypothetical protein